MGSTRIFWVGLGWVRVLVGFSLPSRKDSYEDQENNASCYLESPFTSSNIGPSPLLDYALIEVNAPRNELNNRSLSPEPKYIAPLEQKAVPGIKGPSDIIALTAGKVFVKGRLLAAPSFATAPNSTVTQELWTIQMEGSLEHGDCRCWIVDALNGTVYGYLVAGCPGTGRGSVVPLIHILNDLFRTFGGDWKIAPSTAQITASSNQAGIYRPEDSHHYDTPRSIVAAAGDGLRFSLDLQLILNQPILMAELASADIEIQIVSKKNLELFLMLKKVERLMELGRTIASPSAIQIAIDIQTESSLDFDEIGNMIKLVSQRDENGFMNSTGIAEKATFSFKKKKNAISIRPLGLISRTASLLCSKF